jgi:hypothetical protein
MIALLLALPALAADGVALEAHGLLQTWMTLWDQDVDAAADPVTYGDPELDPGFSLRRARLGLGGTLPTPGKLTATKVWWDVTAGTDAPFDGLSASSPNLSLENASAGLVVTSGRYRSQSIVGLQRVPFSRDNLTSSADLVFQERTIGTEWMLPTTALGVTTAPSLGFGDGDGEGRAKLHLGAFNADDDLFDNAGGGGVFVARGEAGFGGATRTWSPEGKSALGVGASVAFHDTVATEAFLWNVDALARLKWVTLTGGLARSAVSPADTTFASPLVPETTEQMAVYGLLSGFVPVEGDQGVEIAARVDSFDDAGHLDDNGDVLRVHGGVLWRDALPGFDVGAGYVHREELQGLALNNDSVRVWVGVRPRVDVLRKD